MRALLLTVTVLALTATAAWAAPAYLLEPLNQPAPMVPRTCFDAQPESASSTQIIVFTAPGCAPCRRLLASLEASEGSLRSQGVTARQVVVGVDSCMDAARYARGHGDFPVGVARHRDQVRWAIDTTPTTYVVQDGRVVGRAVGVAPVHKLLDLVRR